MTRHAEITLATSVEVYFAHPHPWERGTDEKLVHRTAAPRRAARGRRPGHGLGLHASRSAEGRTRVMAIHARWPGVERDGPRQFLGTVPRLASRPNSVP